MTIISGHGTGTATSDTCSTETDECLCSAEAENSNTHNAVNLIDFKQRASELRIKGASKGAVSAFEASRALALGLMHLNGEGVTQDSAKAAPYLATAASGGIAEARYELARLHLDGTYVPHDPDYAIHLLQRACDDGHVASTIFLAEHYLFGKQCPKDVEQALELLYSVIGKNEPAAMYYLALVYDKEAEYRNSFEAAYWYRRAAEYGHFKSQIRLAALYATGQGVPQCFDTAEAFLEAALESGAEQDPRYLYWQGEHFVEQPETEFLAHALIKAAADMQHTPAQRSMLQHGWRA
jgi:uncharacterized protein